MLADLGQTKEAVQGTFESRRCPDMELGVCDRLRFRSRASVSTDLGCRTFCEAGQRVEGAVAVFCTDLGQALV